uniref:Uncharacterized protein n=1 Tax=Rhizophora mucronata TaxID=61149 RepID=A0A2P2P3H1_RHIMU
MTVVACPHSMLMHKASLSAMQISGIAKDWASTERSMPSIPVFRAGKTDGIIHLYPYYLHLIEPILYLVTIIPTFFRTQGKG